jgi:hypothetical protein
MCVSTGNAGTPKAWHMTTLAVLWPTPGSASSAAKLARHVAAVVALEQELRERDGCSPPSPARGRRCG